MAKAKNDSAKRVFFTEGDRAFPLPNLIAHQKDSWREFVETGLSEIFSELNPIDDYTGQKLSLRFNKYAFDEPKNNITLTTQVFVTNYLADFEQYFKDITRESIEKIIEDL